MIETANAAIIASCQAIILNAIHDSIGSFGGRDMAILPDGTVLYIGVGASGAARFSYSIDRGPWREVVARVDAVSEDVQLWTIARRNAISVEALKLFVSECRSERVRVPSLSEIEELCRVTSATGVDAFNAYIDMSKSIKRDEAQP